MQLTKLQNKPWKKTSELPGFEPGYGSQAGVVLRISSEGGYRMETKN